MTRSTSGGDAHTDERAEERHGLLVPDRREAAQNEGGGVLVEPRRLNAVARGLTLDDPVVHLPVHRDDLLFVEAVNGELAAELAHPFAQVVVAEDLDPALGHAGDVADGEEVAGLAVDDDFGEAAGGGGDDGDLGGHGFEGGHAEGFGFGGEEEEVAGAEDLFEVRDVAEEDNAVAEVVLRGLRNSGP